MKKWMAIAASVFCLCLYSTSVLSGLQDVPERPVAEKSFVKTSAKLGDLIKIVKEAQSQGLKSNAKIPFYIDTKSGTLKRQLPTGDVGIHIFSKFPQQNIENENNQSAGTDDTTGNADPTSCCCSNSDNTCKCSVSDSFCSDGDCDSTCK